MHQKAARNSGNIEAGIQIRILPDISMIFDISPRFSENPTCLPGRGLGIECTRQLASCSYY